MIWLFRVLDDPNPPKESLMIALAGAKFKASSGQQEYFQRSTTHHSIQGGPQRLRGHTMT